MFRQIMLMLVIILIAGFISWLINSAPFIHPWFKALFIGVLCMGCLLYVLQACGVPMPFHLH